MSYCDVFRPCSRVSSGKKQNITVQVSKKSGRHSNGKFYKCLSNYIKTCSITPNIAKFARVKGLAKQLRCSVACEHTTGWFIMTRSNNFVRTCQILKTLGNLLKVVTHWVVNGKLSEVCQKSAPYCNAITNTKNKL